MTDVPGHGALPRWTAFAAVATAAALSLFTAGEIDRFLIPFAWCALAWAGACFVVALAGRGTTARSVVFNLGFVFLLPGLLELYLGWYAPHIDPDFVEEYWVRDDTLGYRLLENTRSRVALWVGSDLVYDVVYTTGENGLRLAPPARGGDDSLCILFFGGSLTYGTGVNDDETSPYLTGAVTGYRHRISNFGFEGYGAHQMLAYLESGRAEAAAGCTPTHAIFHSVYDHLRRAAGFAEWDPYGPATSSRPMAGSSVEGTSTTRRRRSATPGRGWRSRSC